MATLPAIKGRNWKICVRLRIHLFIVQYLKCMAVFRQGFVEKLFTPVVSL